MTAKVQRWCAWSGIVFLVLFGIGFCVVAGLVPPPSPNDSAQQIADFYSQHTNLIRAGLLISIFGVPLAFPFVIVISMQMRRIEGSVAPLSYIQLTTGTVGTLIFGFPLMMMQAAAFRPGQRSIEVTQGLSDAAWLPFVGLISLAIVQNVAIAVAIFNDTRPDPVFPRWLGYFNIWVALGFVPGGFTVFFKTGPFAWDGVFAFWVPLVVFSVWSVVMLVALLKAIGQEEREQQLPTGVPAREPELA
jgi:hypothetical protein